MENEHDPNRYQTAAEAELMARRLLDDVQKENDRRYAMKIVERILFIGLGTLALAVLTAIVGKALGLIGF